MVDVANVAIVADVLVITLAVHKGTEVQCAWRVTDGHFISLAYSEKGIRSSFEPEEDKLV